MGKMLGFGQQIAGEVPDSLSMDLGCGCFVERCEELRDGLDVFICLEDLTWRTWDG